MKVLVAHNRYRSNAPSGENIVVDAEIDALRRSGIEVIPFIRESDSIEGLSPMGKVGVVLGPVRNPQGVHDFRELIAAKRPDVVHVHNVYPLISPWIVREAKAQGIPVVMTVHNFRIDCVAGTYLRDGKVCTDCAGRSVATPALRHGCYRGSHLQSVPMVVGRSVHRGTWKSVDRFFALTTFHADYLRRLGMADEQIVVRPTSVPDLGEPSPPGHDVLFVGRLGSEKGVDVLLDAWAASSASTLGRRLHLVGDGELRPLAEQAAANDASITLHGLLSRDGVNELMRSCGAVVLPSTCFEGLPLVLVEAMAHGRPVIVSDLGGLGSIVRDDFGWKVPASDPQALAHTLTSMTDDDMAVRGVQARRQFLSSFDARVTTVLLIETYESLVSQE